MMRRSLQFVSAMAAITAAWFATPAYSQTDPISQSALDQIQQLLDEKDTRSAGQQKLDAQLVYGYKAFQGLPLGVTVDTMPTTLDVASAGVLVDMEAYPSTDLLAAIAQAGGQVVVASADPAAVRARIPIQFLTAFAGRADVQSMRAADVAALQRPAPKLRPRPIPSHLDLVHRLGLSFFTGSLSSQGDVAHNAKLARSTYGISGAGVRVGLLSDSAEQVSFLIGTGDLPPTTTVVQGSTGTSEGTAMMEIVYDLAPGAQLFFATANGGQANFANNIRALRSTYHCDVIVDDFSYFAEPVFQDGTVSQAVNDVTAAGALYFSAAANSGSLTAGTSGTWEGDFNPDGTSTLVGGTLHQFIPGQSYNVLRAATQVISISWADPMGASTNDYDLFVLNPSGTTVVASSTTIQNGTQSPYEQVASSAGFPAGYRIVITAKAGAAPRAIHLDTHRGALTIATAGSTYGHNAAGNTVGVAAVNWNSARLGTRPFVGGASNPTEPFSSDGPRRIFFTPTGVPITAGNFLFATNGGQVLQKPDIAAADGITARTPGFNPFFGTSAAAPHAAAVAALVKSIQPSLTSVQIYNAMTSTALDIRAAGLDRDSGYGIVMAPQAIAKAIQ